MKKEKKESENKEVKENKHSGIPMSEKSLKEYEQTWKDMEECFELLDEE